MFKMHKTVKCQSSINSISKVQILACTMALNALHMNLNSKKEKKSCTKQKKKRYAINRVRARNAMVMET